MYTVTATDRDDPATGNGRVTYSIVSGVSFNSLFSSWLLLNQFVSVWRKIKSRIRNTCMDCPHPLF